MITETGIVTQADNTTAWVRTTRSSACKSCQSRDTCETVKNQKQIHVKVPNTIGVQQGDEVVLGLETRPLLFLTFLLYVFPVIMLMVGAGIGDTLGRRFNMDPSLCAMGIGFFSFALAFLVIRLKNSSLSQQSQYRPFLVRKRPQAPLTTCHS